MKKINSLILVISLLALICPSINYAQCVQCDNTVPPVGILASEVGSNTTADGDYSFAGGYYSTASGFCSYAFGKNSQAIGNFSYAIGLSAHTEIPGSGSFAIGKYISANASDNFVIGKGVSSSTIFENSVSNSLMIGLNSDLPTFFVGPSDGAGKTGKIGIGNVTDPDAKLHIKSDNYEHASILLEPTGSYYGRLLFGSTTSNHYIQARSGSNMQFKTEDNQDFVFENGNVGIGTNQPKAKIQVKDGDIFIEDIDRGIIMKSPNGSCWRGTVTDEGQLQFTQVDCESLAATSTESLAGKNYGICIYPNPTGNRVNVEITARYTGAQLNIKTPDGRELSTKSLISNSNIINMSNYPAGVYFFYISNKGKLIEVKKVIKE